jgi:predicted PilT family ATPase
MTASPPMMRAALVPDYSWAALGAAIGGLITGLFAWLVQKNKGGTEIEVAVLAEWQKLNGALSNRLSTVEKDFAAYRACMAQKIEELHTRHSSEIDEMRKQHRAEMRAMRELNDGLQRQIAQNSQSTASLLGQLPEAEDDEA